MNGFIRLKPKRLQFHKQGLEVHTCFVLGRKPKTIILMSFPANTQEENFKLFHSASMLHR